MDYGSVIVWESCRGGLFFKENKNVFFISPALLIDNYLFLVCCILAVAYKALSNDKKPQKDFNQRII